MLKVTNLGKADTLQGYMGAAADIMSSSSFKRLLRRFRIAADYNKMRIAQYDEIKLEPDATDAFMSGKGDIVIVTFDNIGYHTRGKKCGYYDTVHIVYTVVPADQLKSDGHYEYGRTIPLFESWNPYPSAPAEPPTSIGISTRSGITTGRPEKLRRVEQAAPTGLAR